MKTVIKSTLFLLAVFIFSNCASIVSKSRWPLSINSNPSGAKVEITDINGFSVYTGTTPTVVVLKSGEGYFSKQTYRVRFSLEGYTEKMVTVDCTLNGWYIANCCIGGWIGWLIVDPLTGAMYRLETESINENLIKSTTSLPELKIMNIADIPSSWKSHLVSIQ